MEKFRIAQYGLMQSAAIVYGVLSCGAAIHIMRPIAEEFHVQTGFYWWASLMRDYGFIILIFPLIWAIFCAFLSSEYANVNFGEGWIVATGWALFFAYVILGSILAFGTVGMLLDN